jgi:hypothetical protein
MGTNQQKNNRKSKKYLSRNGDKHRGKSTQEKKKKWNAAATNSHNKVEEC